MVTLGETMALMHSGTIGSLAHLPSVELAIGGAESNLAIGLSRLGVPTAWVGRVGDDPLGMRVVREIRGEGVEVHCAVDPQRPTGLMIKSRPTGATTRVDYYRSGSAASAIAPADLPEQLIERAELLHISGITPLLSASAHATVLTAVRRAVATGATVSLDVNHRSRLGSRDHLAELLGEILEHVDILIGGPEELALLAPEIDASAPSELLEALTRPGRQVVAKLGPDGAAALAEGRLHEAAGHVVDVVDTVGAGDAFVAGYLSAHLEGLGVPQQLERANACGALACTVPGDWEGAPRPHELAALLAGGSADPVSR
ncbi:ribokinase [Brachybacterium avium]|uniref:Ribokinase n=1 Tax=Brachybacterium avium TaxID=2017485 RepID=A0A220UFW0_9MICO|nr:ribokinase [Brachybacterium avium]